MARGGKRAGAGRKPASPEGAKGHHNIRLRPEIDAAIQRVRAERTCTYTEALEWIIQEWLSNQAGSA